MNGISIVVPIYNEAENVAESYRQISAAMVRCGMPYEILFVDDGSRDATLNNLVVAAGDDVDDGVADANHVIALRGTFPFRHDCVTPVCDVRPGIGRDAYYIRRRS